MEVPALTGFWHSCDSATAVHVRMSTINAEGHCTATALIFLTSIVTKSKSKLARKFHPDETLRQIFEGAPAVFLGNRSQKEVSRNANTADGYPGRCEECRQTPRGRLQFRNGGASSAA